MEAGAFGWRKARSLEGLIRWRAKGLGTVRSRLKEPVAGSAIPAKSVCTQSDRVNDWRDRPKTQGFRGIRDSRSNGEGGARLARHNVFLIDLSRALVQCDRV